MNILIRMPKPYVSSQVRGESLTLVETISLTHILRKIFTFLRKFLLNNNFGNLYMRICFTGFLNNFTAIASWLYYTEIILPELSYTYIIYSEYSDVNEIFIVAEIAEK